MATPLLQSRRPLALLCTLWLLTAAPELIAEASRITATTDILSDYDLFTAGRDPTEIDYYGGEGARRDVIELVLLHQALHLGGYHKPLEIVPEENYRRTLHQVAAGELISSGALTWKADTHDLGKDILLSDPVIENGDFQVGLYTAHNNQKALNTERQALATLKVVSNTHWKTDIQTLQQLGFDNIYLTNTWVSMVRMLAAHRADITLAPFQPGNNMAINQSEGRLIPIPGIKVALTGSRHWIVSAKHPEGDSYFVALQKGLAQLKASGTLERAYRESGFHHPQIAHWKVLK
ncbi:transporter substrate-binding domain-containing protein [Gilvimarinus agarilyticus]|uniref:transporter substrate-binding domain-containing protein n=1 Tax=unclassified Gilvimarinus TaxID=2642066 RepID=UPI001C0A1F52|nr:MULTISPECIES: transporter substrate-binding domain-containing protein [unclassified Gilvimarinus]MBU2885329.1 transporter substrate-binding domain-containing protein [Gilvimarinus agarilyticus]MDO6570228.1 transporter substrate-binding domain-containing protein [Gilvimarinus sp. 2_MG-2023]MDO6748223.1 transporter substrate-binding domain-containing protein [Gilvimarinus sp. 1_MG-2023]